MQMNIEQYATLSVIWKMLRQYLTSKMIKMVSALSVRKT